LNPSPARVISSPESSSLDSLLESELVLEVSEVPEDSELESLLEEVSDDLLESLESLDEEVAPLSCFSFQTFH